MCLDSRRIVDVIHPHGQFDIATAISTRYERCMTKRLMTLDVELALRIALSLLPYPLVDMLDADLPQPLLSLRRVCRNGFWSQLGMRATIRRLRKRTCEAASGNPSPPP